MKTTHGTAYFPSFLAAVIYYQPYGFDSNGVSLKIRLKEIHIGKPPLKENQELKIIDNRYHICE